MNDSVFEAVETSSRVLRLDFSSIEFAKLAEEQDFSEEQIQAVGVVFEHLQKKKVDTTIHTLLKMSRLPLKDPKTFENFDFSVIKGRDANRLKRCRPCRPSMPTGTWRSLVRLEPVRHILPKLLVMNAASEGLILKPN